MIDKDNPQGIKRPITMLENIGANIGFPKYDNSSPLKPTVDRWLTILKGEDWGFPCLRDPEFVEDFINRVPDTTEQDKFVINTSVYNSDPKAQYDSNYVLVFRRTLPSEEPKPEQHWTTEYMIAVNGLRYEISGVHRLHSVILSTRLTDLQQVGMDENDSLKGISDGEIKIKSTPFDQSKCVTRFRPKEQQKKLDIYLATENTQSAASVIQQISQLKNRF